MTLTWVVCGTGRGVGKTHLAQRLCQVLPNAVYAKRGCGRQKSDKPANFFRTAEELASFVDACRDSHEHVVVESNGLARDGQGDVIIFIDGVPNRADCRDDVAVLRAKAHLHVSPNASVGDWQEVLHRKLPVEELRQAVSDVLAEHRRYLSSLAPNSYNGIDSTGDCRMGPET